MDTILYLIIGALLVALWNAFFAVTSLPFGEFLFVIVGTGALAFVILHFIRKNVGKNLTDSTTASQQTPTAPPQHSNGFEAYTRADFEARYPFAEFLSQAEQSIAIFGISLIFYARGKSSVIKQMIQRGLSITFFLLNPDNKELVSRLEKEMRWSNLRGDIIQSITTICSMRKEELNETERKRIELRTFDCIPFLSMIVLDRYGTDPIIEIGNYVHGVDPSLRVAVVSRKSENEKFIEKYLGEYDRIYDFSKLYDCSKLLST